MKKNKQFYIEQLGLQPHPEGGFFKEIYRSSEEIDVESLPPRFNGCRNFATSIYFLLGKNDFSAFHRIAGDELWHFYSGSPLTVYVIDNDGNLEEINLGSDLENGQKFQAVVKAGCWFGSKLTAEGEFALVGCTVAPGFDFEDFEMAKRADLLDQFPQHRKIIEVLTRK